MRRNASLRYTNFQTSENFDAAKVIKDVTTGSPSTASRYRRSSDNVPKKQMSSDAALALLVEIKLSKSQYQGLRSVSIENNCKLYIYILYNPPYKSVLEAKQKCYPSKSEITVTESSAQIKLQSLLNHIAERILLTQSDVIKSLTSDKVRQLDLICKWGCDGTSGQRHSNRNSLMMTELNLIRIFFLLHSYHCSFYQLIKKRIQKSLCGKILGLCSHDIVDQ